MPFQSQAQWKFAFATKQPWAKKWAEDTSGPKVGRFRRLKKRAAKKEINYHAKAGEQISGTLYRGADGKWTSQAIQASGGGAKPKKGKGGKTKVAHAPKPKMTKVAKPKLSPEERKANSVAAHSAATIANIQAVRKTMADGDIGLSPSGVDAMVDFSQGKPLSPTMTDDLVSGGLLQKLSNGTVVMSPSGRVALNSMKRGDTQGAIDAINRADDRVKVSTNRAASQAQKKATVEAARAQRLADRQARQKKADEKRAASQKARATRAKRRTKTKKEPAKTDTRPVYPSPVKVTIPPPTVVKSVKDVDFQSTEMYYDVSATMTTYKSVSGAKRWLFVSSTAYQDRDGEILTRQGLKQAVEYADATGHRGHLSYWHLPSYLGDCDWQMVSHDGALLYESGTFASDEIADWYETAKKEMTLSIEFRHSRLEPLPDKSFENFIISGRSLLPVTHASNVLTGKIE